MADNVLASFVSRSDRGERLQADISSPDERYAVTAVILRKSDPLVSLPFELTLAVFECLEPLAVWTLRSVSRQWHSRLSARGFEQCAVSWWKTHNESDRIRSAQPRALTDEIRHMQALQTGRPFAFATLTVPYFYEFYLQGQYLAYYHRADCDTVTVRDLCTGTTNTYTDETRENLHGDVILTSTLVAFATEAGDWLYWKRLDDSRPGMQRIRLPSANIVRAAGDGDCIIWLVSSNPGPIHDITQIMVFDALTSQLRSVDLPPNWVQMPPDSEPWEWQMLVSSQRKLVDIFYVPELLGGESTPVYHTRFGHDGCHVRENVVHCRHRSFNQGINLIFPRPQKIGIEDVYRLRIHDEGEMLKGHVLFDARRGLFVDNDRAMLYLPSTQARCTVWKGSVYCPAISQESNEDTCARSLGDHVEQRVLEPLQRYRRVGLKSFSSYRDPKSHDNTQLEMDDSILVALEIHGSAKPIAVVHVFCFEEHLPFHGGISTGFWDQGVSRGS